MLKLSFLYRWLVFGIALGMAPPALAGVKSMQVSELEASLRQNQQDFGDRWAARDAEGIVAHYAPEAILFVPGEPAAQGREAFRKFLFDIIDNKDFSLAWAVDRAVASSDGTVGYVYGRYVQHNPRAFGPGYDLETGHYVTTFRREGARWLVIAEINTPGPITSREGLPAADFEASKFPDSAVNVQEAVNLATIRRHIFELWQDGRLGIASALFDVNFVDHNPSKGGSKELDSYLAGVRMMKAGFSDQHYEVTHLFAKDDLVVDHWTLHARYTGDVLGPQGDGRLVSFSGTDIFRLKNGKITDIWHTEEMAGLLDQVHRK